MEPTLQKLIFEHMGILISLAFIIFLIRYVNDPSTPMAMNGLAIPIRREPS